MKVLHDTATAGLRVRDFNLTADVPALSALFSQLGYETAEDTLRSRVAARVSDGATKVLVAEERNRVVGVLVMHVLAPWHEATRWAVVSALVVEERARSHGAGALLLSESENFARFVGCSHIELSSSETRVRAHAFYERAGFAEVRKRFVKRLCV